MSAVTAACTVSFPVILILYYFRVGKLYGNQAESPYRGATRERWKTTLIVCPLEWWTHMDTGQY